jgi:hypothetical protein
MMIEQAAPQQMETRNALLAIGVAGLVGAALDLLQACILAGHDIILVITYGLVGERALKGGFGNYALGVLLHVIISLIFATFYYAVSRKLRFMTEYWFVCGLCFGDDALRASVVSAAPVRSDYHSRHALWLADSHDCVRTTGGLWYPALR